MTNALALIDATQAIQQAKQLNDLVVSMRKDLLKEGVDYGTIPGTNKPTLLKPGAEKLCRALGLTPKFKAITCIERFDGDEPLFYYRYECDLVHIETGLTVGSGIGSCNSREDKYRWRWVDAHQVPASLDKDSLETRTSAVEEFTFGYDKRETTGKYGKPESYWQQFDEAIQNGTAKKVQKATSSGKSYDAWRIESVSYRIPNPAICDQINTIDKMAQKRSLLAAILIAANASEFFTQDIEDMADFGSVSVVANVDDNNIIEGDFTASSDRPKSPFNRTSDSSNAVSIDDLNDDAPYDFQLVMKDERLADIYKASQHRAGAINKLSNNGVKLEDMTVGEVVQMLIERKEAS